MTKRMTLVANIEGEGCLGKAALDEPVFVLRARDALATDAIGEWIQHARFKGVNPKKITAALDDLSTMIEWQKQHGTKLPD